MSAAPRQGHPGTARWHEPTAHEQRWFFVVPDADDYLGPEAQARVEVDRKPASETPWTKEPWVYDLRTNQHFTLKENLLRDEHLADFIAVYRAEDRTTRVDSDRFRRFPYEELVARDKASLDFFWLRDESFEEADNLPAPELIAAEIVEDLEAALAQFAEIASSLAADQED